jgi:hypothetical protein
LLEIFNNKIRDLGRVYTQKEKSVTEEYQKAYL